MSAERTAGAAPVPVRLDVCSACRYAEAVTDPQNLGTVFYVCRRYPPALIVAGGKLMANFPMVAAEAWCGEWRAAA